MRYKTFNNGIIRRLVVLLVLALPFIISPSPAFALSLLEKYFTLDYEIELSDTKIDEGERFSARVEAIATCKKELPLGAFEGYMTAHIVAVHQDSGIEEILNPSYTINIKPFPNFPGDSTQISEVVPLAFPRGARHGIYDIVARLTEAKVRTSRGWITLTHWIPPSEPIGSVTYVEIAEIAEEVKAPAPAAFTVSNLSITPAEVYSGEEVTITVLVTNTGDLSGSYQVVLKIDAVAVASKEVTLAGGTSETVTFTTTKNIAGSYSVTVDGLSGTFEVKTAAKTAAKPIKWQLIAIIVGVSAAIAVPLTIRWRRRRLA